MSIEAESTGSSVERSCHWLLGAHEELVANWTPFQSCEISHGFQVSAVTPDRVSAFVEFENNARTRCVGAPLLEHLRRFGRNLAFVCLREGRVITIQRYRLYHEFDSNYRTLLAAYGNVEQQFRSVGVGRTMLMTAANYFSHQNGIKSLAGEVWPENKAAIRYTVKAGYVVHSRMSSGQVVLIKQLNHN